MNHDTILSIASVLSVTLSVLAVTGVLTVKASHKPVDQQADQAQAPQPIKPMAVAQAAPDKPKSEMIWQ